MTHLKKESCRRFDGNTRNNEKKRLLSVRDGRDTFFLYIYFSNRDDNADRNDSISKLTGLELALIAIAPI